MINRLLLILVQILSGKPINDNIELLKLDNQII